MAEPKVSLINKFYGGIQRDDKSKVVGAAANVEEVDIFSNGDFIQPEQITSALTVPASTEVYAFDTGKDDTIYGYGKETSGGKVRIVSGANSGASSPGSLSTLFTSGDATNLATIVSDLKYFETTEANGQSVYYIHGASATWYLGRYNIAGAAEERWTGSAWSSSGSPDSNTQLTGLDGSFDRPTIKVIFGELFITHGRFVCKVDKDGVVSLTAFTLPKAYEGVDIIPVSDRAIILCRNVNRLVNITRGFWWDLTTQTQFDDSFTIPVGGPCWIIDHRGVIRILCAINGTARFFHLSGAYPGGVPVEDAGLSLPNINAEASTQPISSPKMVAVKDKILYFGLYKTDKTGIYGLGQLDADKPLALILSKRFSTGDYSTHKPIALFIQGPNYYAGYFDGSNNVCAQCFTNNSPSRSSNAVYESTWQDNGNPFANKTFQKLFIETYPLAASTSIAPSIGVDYSASYTAVTRPDGSVLNTTSAIEGYFLPTSFTKKKVYRVKIAWTSSGTSAVKVTAIGMVVVIQDLQ